MLNEIKNNEAETTNVVVVTLTNFEQILRDCKNGIRHNFDITKDESLRLSLLKDKSAYELKAKGGTYDIVCAEQVLIRQVQSFAVRNGFETYGHNFVSAIQTEVNSFAELVNYYGFDQKQQKSFLSIASKFYNSFDVTFGDGFLYADALTANQVFELVKAVCNSFAHLEVTKISDETLAKFEVRREAKNAELLKMADALKGAQANGANG